ACSFGPPASHLGTRLLPVCRVRAAHGFPPHARRSFFERVHGLGILLVSLGPGAHMREAQGLEGAIDRIVRYREPELLMQPHDQIARPPAHHAMDRSDWALLYDAGEKGLMNSVELGRHPRRRNIDETVRRRRRPPHGRRTETTGEWPPATRGSPPAPAEDGPGRGPPP